MPKRPCTLDDLLDPVDCIVAAYIQESTPCILPREANLHLPLTYTPPAKMVKSTLVVRASDALPLAASVDDEQVSLVLALLASDGLLKHTHHQTEQALTEHKQQAKLIFRRITPNAEPRCSIESGQYTLQYVSGLPRPWRIR